MTSNPHVPALGPALARPATRLRDRRLARQQRRDQVASRRRLVLADVRAHPGSTEPAIGRRLGMGRNSVRSHLRHLVRGRHLRSERRHVGTRDLVLYSPSAPA